MKKILRHLGLCVGIPIAAEQFSHVRELRLRDRGAAAEHHMLERMGLSGELLLVGADPIVQRRHRDGSERVAYGDDLQAVVQRRSRHRELGGPRVDAA